MTDELRGDLRIIYTDGPGASAVRKRDMGDDVWAFVGPIGRHTSHPELQRALGLVAMAFNRRHGRLSKDKHAELIGREDYSDAADLLREALAPVK